MAEIKIMSWNVNGLGDKIKRGVVSQFIRRHSPDVVLLQETHMKGSSFRALDRGGYRMAVHSGFTSGSRGVGILLKKSLPLMVDQIQTDKQGRYAILTGSWEGTVLNLLSIYIPPRLHGPLFADLGTLLLNLPLGTLIAGGDYNAIIDVKRDRWPTGPPVTAKRPLVEFIEAMGLQDLWRTHNPTTHQYTFQSGAHGSMSRIDHILVNTHHSHEFADVHIKARGISDHSPVWAILRHRQQLATRHIVISPWYLQIPRVREKITEATTLYFGENENSVESAITLWEAYKAVLKGQTVSFIAGHNKEKRAKLNELEEELLSLERSAVESTETGNMHQVKIKRKEYRDIAEEAAKYSARATQHRIYEAGDKAGKLLAWLSKRDMADRWVPSITQLEGKTVTGEEPVEEVFAKYYAHVYKSSVPKSAEESRELLAEIQLPELTGEQKKALDADITVNEIEQAIHGLKSGKAPGPNGLPIEFYKLQTDTLAPYLLRMFLECREQGSLPEDQRLATIVVLHKEGKPRDDCAGYRPISLLNVEAKVLAKVLASRLVGVITDLVHADQSGFMPRRSTMLNLRRLNAVMGKISNLEEDAVILSLDAKMAFDSIEWSYMLAVLQRLGFGPVFLSWIGLLYTDPLAQVKVNGKRSRTFSLHRGTRQGCPLSPLIFALVLEPLAEWIR